MDLDLQNKQWKEFELSAIFKIHTGAQIPKRSLKQGNIPRITATDTMNGIFEFYNKCDHKNYRELKNFISVSFLGSVFYHSYTASIDMKIHAIKLHNKELDKYLAEFLTIAIKRAVSSASYGTQISSTDLSFKKIYLPIDSQGNPDYVFMEAYMRQKEQERLDKYLEFAKKRLQQLKNYKNVGELDSREWKGFYIGELFSLSQGKSKGLNHLRKMMNGINYLGATNLNNGVLTQVIQVNELVHRGNAIAFIRNGEGSMGYSVYKAEEFIATSDISVGYSDFLNRYTGIFITTIADKVRGKYNFGYKRSDRRLKKEKIMLPVNQDSEPDYEFMENYTKRLEYQKLSQYLDLKQNQLP